MTSKENFKKLVKGSDRSTFAKNRERIKNRSRLRESQGIALKVLEKLDELDWTQRRLAEELGVSPQQITKIVRGKENLTLETQVKLQEVLDIPILASYYEKEVEERADSFKQDLDVLFVNSPPVSLEYGTSAKKVELNSSLLCEEGSLFYGNIATA